MKKLIRYFLPVLLFAGFTACDDNDKTSDIFELVGETTFNTGTEGELISVSLRSNVDYKATAEYNWCTIENKQQIGFKILVAENESIRDRENRITIETNGFEPVVLTVKQHAGEIFFDMEDSEKLKAFTPDGGAKPVEFQTNIEEYEVTLSPLVNWCTISDKTVGGFIIELDPNDDSARHTELTVSYQGVVYAVIAVSQTSGRYLEIEQDERSKTFAIEGTTQTVAISTNIDNYEVSIPAGISWVSISNKTRQGFDVTLDPNDDIKRSVVLTVTATEVDPVMVTINQLGPKAILQNGRFVGENFDPWTQTDPNMFGLNSWTPGSMPEAYSVVVNPSLTAPGSGYLLQYITGIPDGTYTFSFIGRGEHAGRTGTLNVVHRDKDGNETLYDVTNRMQSNWDTIISVELQITGGECTVGLRLEIDTIVSNQRIGFNLCDFILE